MPHPDPPIALREECIKEIAEHLVSASKMSQEEAEEYAPQSFDRIYVKLVQWWNDAVVSAPELQDTAKVYLPESTPREKRRAVEVAANKVAAIIFKESVRINKIFSDKKRQILLEMLLDFGIT